MYKFDNIKYRTVAKCRKPKYTHVLMVNKLIYE